MATTVDPRTALTSRSPLKSSLFKPATRHQIRLRMGLAGPSGSGKTFTTLRLAHSLSRSIAVISTEPNIEAYLGLSPDGVEWDFQLHRLKTFAPTEYTAAIAEAGRCGFEVLIVDGLSQAWEGEGGALDLVDRKAADSRSGNSYTAWRDVTPMHRRMIDSILNSPCHVFATLRTKTEYVLEQDPKTGKMVPKKVGLAPIQRQGMEYEFDIFGDIDLTHTLTVSKSRCQTISDQIVVKPGAAFMAPVIEWLNEGEELPAGYFDATEEDLRERERSQTKAELETLSTEEKARRAAARRKQAGASSAQNGSASAPSASGSSTKSDQGAIGNVIGEIRTAAETAYANVDEFKAAIAAVGNGKKLSEFSKDEADKLLVNVLRDSSARRQKAAQDKLDASGTANPNGNGDIRNQAVTEAAEPTEATEPEDQAANGSKRNLKPTKAMLARIKELRGVLQTSDRAEDARKLLADSGAENGTLDFETWSRAAANVYIEKLNELATAAFGHASEEGGQSATNELGAAAADSEYATPEQVAEVKQLAEQAGWPAEGEDKSQAVFLKKNGVGSFRSLKQDVIADLITRLRKKIAAIAGDTAGNGEAEQEGKN